MKDGFWINYRTGQVFVIDEHERWIRDEANARMLGVPERVIARFYDFKPSVDRDRFLLFVMKTAPVMRVRGHGVTVTLEFWARFKSKPMNAVRLWAEKNAGPLTLLNICNLSRGTCVRVPYPDLHRYLCPKPRSIADLPPDERRRAKALLLGAGAGAAMRPGPDGKIVVQTENDGKQPICRVSESSRRGQ
ncbi:MAG: hypothetical protein WCK89_20955 [bacterium]